jgi:putative glutathione S-transferase
LKGEIMGMLQEGRWVDQWDNTKETDGQFVRKAPQFRNWITADGSSGPTGDGGFKAEARRYHLYVSLACPWAHRTLIFRTVKGLEDMISISVVHWYMADKGWTFQPGDGAVPDTVNGADYLHQVYTAAKPDYSGRVTVPVLWDKKTKTIVSNESPEIIRMFNSAFDGIGATVFVKQVVRRFHAASLISGTLILFSGLSQTGPAGCQFWVLSDQRCGFCARAVA